MAQTLYNYIVRGKGNFPIDMLRYDSAWPAGSIDAVRIEQTFAEKTIPQEIRIHSYRPPSRQRWERFGWSVEEWRNK